MSYGRVKYEYNGKPIGGVPVREGVARGRVLGKIKPGSVFKVIDSQYYEAGRRNPKAGVHLKICASVNGKKIFGWMIGRYSHPISDDAFLAVGLDV